MTEISMTKSAKCDSEIIAKSGTHTRGIILCVQFSMEDMLPNDCRALDTQRCGVNGKFPP